MQGFCEATRSERSLSVNMLCRLLAIAAFASWLSGCSLLQKVGILSEPEPVAVPLSEQPYELKLRLSTSNDLNPDTQSRPSPIEVRVFVMEPKAEVKDTSFEVMFDYADNVMDPRPLSTLTLRPGQTRDLLLPAVKSQSMLVVAAGFRDPYQTLWKAVASLDITDTVSVTTTIGANTVVITPDSL